MTHSRVNYNFTHFCMSNECHLNQNFLYFSINWLCLTFFYLSDLAGASWAAPTHVLNKLNTTLLLQGLLNFPNPSPETVFSPWKISLTFSSYNYSLCKHAQSFFCFRSLIHKTSNLKYSELLCCGKFSWAWNTSVRGRHVLIVSDSVNRVIIYGILNVL